MLHNVQPLSESGLHGWCRLHVCLNTTSQSNDRLSLGLRENFFGGLPLWYNHPEEFLGDVEIQFNVVIMPKNIMNLLYWLCCVSALPRNLTLWQAAKRCYTTWPQFVIKAIGCYIQVTRCSMDVIVLLRAVCKRTTDKWCGDGAETLK